MSLKVFEKEDIARLIKVRDGESKLGEKVQLGANLQFEDLEQIDAQFVIIGVPEDVGPRANMGKAGAESGWEHFLSAFLNVQSNSYLSGSTILLLGELDFREYPHYHSNDIKKLRELVNVMDEKVSDLIRLIVKADKIPILIGGGHNNAYGLLKGCSLALDQKMNCINFDPHADYREMEGRHSGNGFRYAKEEGYLGKYYISGIHQNYNSERMLELLNKEEDISYCTFDGCIIQGRSSYKTMLKKGLDWVQGGQYGVELDCDAIQHFPSSAQTTSGFSPNQARMFAYQAAAHANAHYFHLTEAAPSLAGEQAGLWGKLMSYLVCDFIKGKNNMLSSSQ